MTQRTGKVSSSKNIFGRRLGRRGSFLIEALLSVMILSISLTLIVQSIASSLRAGVYSADYMLALNIAENKMFDLLREQSADSGLHEEEAVQVGGREFSTVRESNSLSGEGFEGLNEIKVAVEWKKSNKNSRLQLETYLPQPTENEAPHSQN